MKTIIIAVIVTLAMASAASAHYSSRNHYHPGAQPGSAGSYANPGWNQQPSNTYGGPQPRGNGPYAPFGSGRPGSSLFN